MATYLQYGKYTQDAVKKISEVRYAKVNTIVKKNKGKILSTYVLLGDVDHDFVNIVELPGLDEALKVSIELYKATGISFTTTPALGVKSFFNLMSKR